jgi:hypothetical protein
LRKQNTIEAAKKLPSQKDWQKQLFRILKEHLIDSNDFVKTERFSGLSITRLLQASMRYKSDGSRVYE